MKVVVFARNSVSHPYSGGMEVVLDTLAGALSAEGADVALVTTEGYDATMPRAARYSAVWQVAGSRVGRYSRAWWKATGGPGPWDEWAPDVAIGIGDAGGGYARRQDRTVPIVIQSHGTPSMEAASAFTSGSVRGIAQGMLNLLRVPSRRRFYRAADQVWAVGERVAAEIRGVRPDGDVEYMPNAIDTEAFRFDKSSRASARANLELGGDDFVLLFAGRLEKQKGAELAIRLLEGEDGGSVADVLLIAGGGSDEARLRRLAGNTRVNGRVRFLGSMGREDIARLMSAADAFVFPTLRREGLPMSVLEAAAAGLPIVTTPTAGVPGDVRGAGSVAIVDPARLPAWQQALQEIRLSDTRNSYLPDAYSLWTYGARHRQRLADAIERYAR